jgi:predicted dehydrogenase
MECGVGIVGTGMVAGLQAQALAGAEGARLVSVLSRSAERAASFAAQHGCRGFSEPREFLADPRLQLVSVCTPPGEHLRPALQALAAGRHVLVEKPLEADLRGCDAIIRAAAARGLRAGGIFQSRFHESARLLKQAVDQGRFGRLALGEASVKWWRSQQYYDQGGWKSRKANAGGALLNQAIHAVDLLLWFLGPVQSVQAQAATLGHDHLEVEDTAVAALRFANGACGLIQASTAAYPGFLKRIEISGSGGTAILEEESLKVWQFAQARPEDEGIRRAFAARTTTTGGAADPAAISLAGHRAQFEDFAACLRENRPPRVDAVEARKAVALILAIQRSARTGRRARPEA